MTAFFEYPKAAFFGSVLPKTKIYAHAKAGAKLKQLFVDQVEQVVWQYKLAPETINISATDSVSEIQVFSIDLRNSGLDEKVLQAIDKAIPFPIIFELSCAGNCKVIAAYKRPSEADSTKWVISEYFSTGWEDLGYKRSPLPQSLNLSRLYDALLRPLLPVSGERNEPIAALVERVEAISAKLRETDRIKARLAKVKQFNKRVAINAELRGVEKELRRLRDEMSSK